MGIKTSHVKADLPSYVTGDLSEPRRREVEAHLETCEACRHLANKIKAKQARLKRQALKTAVPDRVPNLLLNRLGKQAGLDQPPHHVPWIWFGVMLIAAGIAFFALRKDVRTLKNHPLSVPVVDSTATVSAIPSTVEVATAATASSPAALAAAVTSAATAPVPAQPAQELPPTPQRWTGSAVGDISAHEIVVKGRSAWRTLWSELQLPDSAPRLNFYEVMVVGYVADAQPAGAQVMLYDPKEDAQSIAIPYKILAGSSASVANSTVSANAAGHPYAVMTMPRSSKEIRFVPIP